MQFDTVSRQTQVLSQLPSLHQVNLRGCPIADMPDYQAQLLQQLPMLDVLNSKKVYKPGMVRSAKPAVATAQPKKSLGSEAVSKPESPSDGPPDDSLVKSQKRRLQPQAETLETLGGPKLKKARKERLVVSSDAVGIADVKETATTTAAPIDAKASGGQDAEVEKETLKSGKKRKSKAGRKSQQQAAAADSSRSFLADVLDPAKPDTAAKPADNVDSRQPSVAVATAGDANTSGLVKVVDVQRKAKSKKAKHSKEIGGKSKDKASGVSGSSAAQLLQSGLGLDAMQVGLGGTGAWD